MLYSATRVAGAVDLAVERGEVVCRAFSVEAYFSREPFHTWRKKGFSDTRARRENQGRKVARCANDP
jgi:hypothetical protein